MEMRQIQVDETTGDALARRAEKRGLSIAAYLRGLVAGDEDNGSAADTDRLNQEQLHARMKQILETVSQLPPPVPQDSDDRYTAALKAKYRRQGLTL